MEGSALVSQSVLKTVASQGVEGSNPSPSSMNKETEVYVLKPNEEKVKAVRRTLVKYYSFHEEGNEILLKNKNGK